MNSRSSSPAEATTPSRASWEAQRRHLSHDALRNLAILTVRRLERVATGRVVDPTFEGRELGRRLEEIRQVLSEIDEVIASCASANSPSTALKNSQLSRLESGAYRWLSRYLDRRWRDRHQLSRKSTEAKLLIRDARKQLLKLERLGASLNTLQADEAIATCASDLAKSLTRLAELLSSLPRGPIPC